MATGGQPQTPDNRIFLFRLQILVIDGGLLVMRNIMDQTLTFKCITLRACFSQEKTTITRLKNRGVITQVQYDVLFPTGGQVPTLSDLDITLIICLLRNLKCFGLNQKFDWRATPAPTDVSIEADICRLKDFRNKISHISTTTVIQQNDFTTMWNDIEQVLVRLSSPAVNIQQTIAEFKTIPLDLEEERRIEEEMKKLNDYEAVVKRLLLAMTDVEEYVIDVKKDLEGVKEYVTEVRRGLEDMKENVTDVQKVKKDIEDVKENDTAVKRGLKDIEENVTKVKKDLDEIKRRQAADVQPYCRKTYKGRGNIRITNKTFNIGIKQMSIGNIVVNPTSDKTDKREQVLPKPEKTGLFESFYSESSAREEECHQFASTVGMNAGSPRGNFIDTRDLFPITESVFESSVRVEASRSVCMICFPGGRATGFRVGTRYIMTANHVVNHILISKGYGQMGNNPNCLSTLQSEDVFALFEYKKDEPISEHQKFSFTAAVPFRDNETDCAILELEEKCNGTELPRSFKYFSLPRLNQRFTFIGHSLGKLMEFNHVDKIIDIGSVQTKSDIIQVKQKSLEHSGKDYDMPPHNILTNPKRFLFHCKFTKGASGSPGVVTLPDGRYVVVTMLLCGLPDWYYDSNVDARVICSWPKDHCVEQGVNLKSVYEKMYQENKSLCYHIFNVHEESSPNSN
ncbi:uncharacterized protein LOC132735549 [Ruditapes philippinarum]|uniref:uncharacterized protein LOC132735549 n=1 Tax=Ruditapes philippinarum TaxID=129788 RepID=UPI00295B4E79|nr:uncharacterized protein LOC132735549 [Ruditapes philippinarum]